MPGISVNILTDLLISLFTIEIDKIEKQRVARKNDLMNCLEKNIVRFGKVKGHQWIEFRVRQKLSIFIKNKNT